MRAWLVLFCAIAFEVIGILTLKLSALNHHAAGFLITSVFLTLSYRFRLIHLYRVARPPVKKGMSPDLIWASFQRLASGRQRGLQVAERGKVLISQIDIGERPEPFGGL